MHPVHPQSFTLHAQDLVEFCHVLQTGLEIEQFCVSFINEEPPSFNAEHKVRPLTLSMSYVVKLLGLFR